MLLSLRRPPSKNTYVLEGGGFGEEGGGGKGGGEVSFFLLGFVQSDIASEELTWLTFEGGCTCSSLFNNKFKVSQIFFWYRFPGSLC